MTYPYPINTAFSVFAFIGFVMCAIPLPWHLQAWNTGTCLYMIWTGLGCLNLFINSIIWRDNAINWAPVWCDISIRIIIGMSIAIPAASLCINRRLYHIACVRTVTTTKADKRRAVLVDLAIGVGLPVLGMILYYIPQGHRFDIYEGLGCIPFSTYTWPIIPIFYLPPIVIGLFSGTYAFLTIIALYKNRSQCMALLSSNSSATSSRFIRLMCLAGIEILFTIPITSWNLWLTTRQGPLYPWVSWEFIHVYFSHVDQFPAVEWRNNRVTETGLESARWSLILCAFAFFAFFGFADEAKKNYRWAFQSIAKRAGISTGSFGSGETSFLGSNGMKSKGAGSTGRVRPILPVFVHKQMLQRHDSLDSFTDMSIGDGDALNQKSDSEKQEQDSCLTLSYGAMSIADLGGTLADVKDEAPLSPASNITQPPPAHTPLNSREGIEISSVHPNSSYIESSNSLATAV